MSFLRKQFESPKNQILMATRRKVKTDHLIKPGGWADSRSKSGVWFAEKKAFKSRQRKVLAALKQSVNWVPIEGAIMVVSHEPAGVVVIAPNPTLPGIMVFSNGSTPENTARLQEEYTAIVSNTMESSEVEVFHGVNEPSYQTAMLN